MKDPWLARIERTSMAACLLMAAVALAVARGDWRVAGGVLGGGLLIAVSYVALALAVDALVQTAAAPGNRHPNLSWTVAKLAGRYALLAVLAYVMIARLRLHPVGLLVGASSVVAAASVEALRLLLKK